MSNGLHIFAFLCHVYRVPVTKKLPSFPFYEDTQLENKFTHAFSITFEFITFEKIFFSSGPRRFQSYNISKSQA